MSGFTYYMVGGAVRDHFLGRTAKDVDFVCVVDGVAGVNNAYGAMHLNLVSHGLTVRTTNPEFGTLRATGKLAFAGKFYDGTFDFVLARRDVGGSDGRHPKYVEVGTLEDDLARRDFTMNAMAMDQMGQIIDPHDGQLDMEAECIATVGSAVTRFNEDRLRVLRALRFAVTYNFTLNTDIERALNHLSGNTQALLGVSDQRVWQELDKMFRVDPYHSMHLLERFGLREALPKKLWFKPTLEAK